MELNFTEKQKERIIQHYKERLERELKDSKKRMELINNPETNKIASDLQNRLVQCCIDYINETGNTQVAQVVFTADMLNESAKYGSWQPCTDSTCEIEDATGEMISFSA